MTYHGSCHCKRIEFKVEGTIDKALACNCSICQRKGSLLWFVPLEKFHLLSPESNSATYTFNKHSINHRFCTVCGIHPYANATDRKGQPTAAINIRCIEGIDLATIPVTNFDGRSL